MKSEYPYREIAPKVYMINEFNVADCYLLVGTERALLIDMGVGLGNLRAFVQRLTDGLPLDVVATHGHVDHIGGRGQFPRVSVQKEDVGIIGRVTVPYRKAFFALQRQAAPYGVKAKDIRPGEYHSEPLPMHEGQVFRLGGKTVSVTHVPGHTRGSVCLLAEEDRLLFTGDNGNPVLFLFLPNCATLETWLRSAKRMLALARETGAAMYSGHGFSELAEETVQAQIRHMEAILTAAPRKNAHMPRYQVSRQKENGLLAIYRGDLLWDER